MSSRQTATDSPDSLRWYVAVAERNAVVERKKRGRESDAEFRQRIAALPPQTVMERLEAEGMEVFYPKIRESRERPCKTTRAPIRETVWVGPFGRYVFAGTEEGPAAIRAVRGVTGLVLNANNEPGVVPAAQIERMRHDYRNYKQVIRAQSIPLKPGQQVRLVDGPFRSYDAEVKSIDKLCRGMFDAIVMAHGKELPLKDVPIEDVAVI